jgi:hypothetical protein
LKELDRTRENLKSEESSSVNLELVYINEYLHEKGISTQDLATLPEREAATLMAKASQYASLKLAELESRARLRTKIRNVTDSQ